MTTNLRVLTLLGLFAGMTSAAVVAAAPRVELDSTFGTNGIARIAPTTTSALLPDGRILTLGQDSETQVLYRYTKTGTPDLAFGTDGAIRLLPNGSALVPGNYSNILVAADGRFYIAALAAEPCKVNPTCTGSVLARYLPSGQVDATFGTAGFAVLAVAQFTPQGINIQLAFDPDGSIVAAENAFTSSQLFPTKVQTVIERVSSTGTSLASWSTDSSCGPGAYGVAVQDDGRVIVTMARTTGSSQTSLCLSRYARNGTLDTSFGNAGVVNYGTAPGQSPYAGDTSGTLLLPDGKMIVGAVGSYPTPADTFGNLSRFLPSGQTDTSFGVPSGSGIAPANVNTIAASCGGKIVGATMGHDSFYTYIGLTRYNSNGSVDTTASGTPDGIVSDFISFLRGVTNVLVRDDGEIIVHAFARIGSAHDARAISLLVGFRQLDCQHPYDSTLQPVVEYYNPSLDHYFMSSAAADMTSLDSGHFVGWQRTGYTFASATTVTNPVCRFYIPPAYGDSHFFSASAAECGDVQAKFPQFVLETLDAMRANVPDLITGDCVPPSTVQVYRVWDKRADTNHRYTTDRELRDAMVAKGWVAEGYGPSAVAMCALPQ